MKNNIVTMIKKNRIIVLGALIGGLGGYAYYYFVGCASGTCAITSSPINSTLYGTVVGGLFFDLIKSIFLKNTKNGKQ